MARATTSPKEESVKKTTIRTIVCSKTILLFGTKRKPKGRPNELAKMGPTNFEPNSKFRAFEALENFKIKIRAQNSEKGSKLVYTFEEKGGGRSNKTRQFPPPLPRRPPPAAAPSPASPATTTTGEKREPNLHPKGSSSSILPKPRGSVKFGMAGILMGSFVPFGGFFPSPFEMHNLLSSSNQSTRCNLCNEKYEQEASVILKGGPTASVVQMLKTFGRSCIPSFQCRPKMTGVR